MRLLILSLLSGLCVAYSSTSTAAAVRGREYIETERRIVTLTKQMVGEQRDVEAFGNLVEELDATFAEGSTRSFWQVARRVSESMKHEVAENQKRLARETMSTPKPDTQKAGAIDVAPAGASPDGGLPLARRTHKMQSIVRETEGLRKSLQFNDPSVIARYRHLVGEFQALLEADIAEMKGEIDALRVKNGG